MPKEREHPITLSTAKKYIALIKTFARTATVAGSYRRKKDPINDIDIIVREPLDKVISRAEPYTTKVLSLGSTKASIRIRLRDLPIIQVDFMRTTSESLPFAKLYFTGSKKFNIHIRAVAKAKGYLLNEYGLYKNGKPVHDILDLRTERDILQKIGVTYRPPAER